MTSKQKINARPLVKDTSDEKLEHILARTKKTLNNKNLLPQSVVFYSRRTELIEAEIKRRATRGPV